MLKLKHPDTGHEVSVNEGFNWYAFLLTPIFCLTNGLILYAVLFFAVAVISVGFGMITWVIAGFKGNQWIYDSYIKKGYLPTDKADQAASSDLDRLGKLNDLKSSGAINEEEYQKEKSKIMGE